MPRPCPAIQGPAWPCLPDAGRTPGAGALPLASAGFFGMATRVVSTPKLRWRDMNSSRTLSKMRSISSLTYMPTSLAEGSRASQAMHVVLALSGYPDWPYTPPQGAWR